MKEYRNEIRWSFVFLCVNYLIESAKNNFIFSAVDFVCGMMIVMLGFMLLTETDDENAKEILDKQEKEVS